jgi:hypothetical protein
MDGAYAPRAHACPPLRDHPDDDDPYGLLAGLDGPGQLSALRAGLLAGDPTRPSIASLPTPREGSDDCGQCGAAMTRSANDLAYVCGSCGLVIEGDTAEPEDEGPRAAPSAPRLRLVGVGSNQLQPDLYRSGVGVTPESQKKQIYEEYCRYCAQHVSAGNRAISCDAFSRAADLYNDVQRQCVVRSQRKKAIMAACLHQACLMLGFAPGKVEIAKFMRLEKFGLARGVNYIRSMAADGKMAIDPNLDPCWPEIVTLFAHLGRESADFDGLRAAVADVVGVAIRDHIGLSSILRSKVAGAAYTVLRRCLDRRLVPEPITMQAFCVGRIRKNTVERFTRAIGDCHTHFVDCYVRAGLDASPP